jgi:hypothetical protein
MVDRVRGNISRLTAESRSSTAKPNADAMNSFGR